MSTNGWRRKTTDLLPRAAESAGWDCYTFSAGTAARGLLWKGKLKMSGQKVNTNEFVFENYEQGQCGYCGHGGISEDVNEDFDVWFSEDSCGETICANCALRDGYTCVPFREQEAP